MNESAKEYFTLEEAAEHFGWNRATVYKWMKTLDIKTHKFKLNKKAYIAASDIQRIEEAKAKPWLVGLDEEKPSDEAA